MKISKVFCFCICLACATVMLLGCILHTDSMETINITVPINYTVSVTSTEPETIEQGPMKEGTSVESGEKVQLKFDQILSGNGCFKIEWLDENVTIEDYCASWEPSGTAHVTQYGFADLDYDEVPELILRLTEDEGIDLGMLVIRYEDNHAIGYEFTYRQMIDLKEDGTFGYAGGINDTGYAKLRFSEGNWEYEKICNIVEDDEITFFFCKGEPVSEDVYWNNVDEQKRKKGIEWIDYL